MSERSDYIHNKYAQIAAKLDGARIYGELIDQDDIRQVVIAAYFLGIVDADVTPPDVVERNERGEGI